MQKIEENNTDLSDVEFYGIKFDLNKQDRLIRIRRLVKEQFPNSSDRIYYGIPTVELDGKIILQYAAYKKHISLIVCYDLAAYLQEQYPEYRYTRATVIFQDNEPFPDDFVKEIFKILGSKRWIE